MSLATLAVTHCLHFPTPRGRKARSSRRKLGDDERFRSSSSQPIRERRSMGSKRQRAKVRVAWNPSWSSWWYAVSAGVSCPVQNGKTNGGVACSPTLPLSGTRLPGRSRDSALSNYDYNGSDRHDCRCASLRTVDMLFYYLSVSLNKEEYSWDI